MGRLLDFITEAPDQGKRAEPKRASPREGPKIDCDEVSSHLPKTYQNTPLATVVVLAYIMRAQFK